MEFVILTIFIFIISFLWALWSLRKELKKEKERIEETSYRKNKMEWNGEEVVLFERKF